MTDQRKRQDLMSLYYYAQGDVYETIANLLKCYADLNNSIDEFSDDALRDAVHSLRLTNLKLKRIKQKYLPVKIRDRN